MQNQPVIKHTFYQNPFNVLFAALDRRPRIAIHKQESIPSDPSGEWYRMNYAASTTSDFWICMVGRSGKKPVAPLDR